MPVMMEKPVGGRQSGTDQAADQSAGSQTRDQPRDEPRDERGPADSQILDSAGRAAERAVDKVADRLAGRSSPREDQSSSRRTAQERIEDLRDRGEVGRYSTKSHYDVAQQSDGPGQGMEFDQFLFMQEQRRKGKKDSRLESPLARSLQTILPESVVEDILDEALKDASQATALGPSEVDAIIVRINSTAPELIAQLALGEHSVDAVIAGLAEHLSHSSNAKLSAALSTEIAEIVYESQHLNKISEDVRGLSRKVALEALVRRYSASEESRVPTSQAETGVGSEQELSERLERVLQTHADFLERYPHYRAEIEKFAREQHTLVGSELALMSDQAFAGARAVEALLQANPRTEAEKNFVRQSLISALSIENPATFALTYELLSEALGEDLAVSLRAQSLEGEQLPVRVGFFRIERERSQSSHLQGIADFAAERFAGNPMAAQAAHIAALLGEEQSTEKLLAVLDREREGLEEAELEQRRAALAFFERTLGGLEQQLPHLQDVDREALRARIAGSTADVVVADVMRAQLQQRFSVAGLATRLEGLSSEERSQVLSSLRDTPMFEHQVRENSAEAMLLTALEQGNQLDAQVARISLKSGSPDLQVLKLVALVEGDRPAFEQVRERYQQMFHKDLISELRGTDLSPNARYLIEGLARGENLSPLHLRGLIERESQRLGQQLGTEEAQTAEAYRSHEQRERLLQEQQLLQGSIAQLGQRPENQALAAFSTVTFNQAREAARIESLIEQSWEHGYQSRHAGGITGERNNGGEYFVRAQQALMLEHAEFIHRVQAPDGRTLAQHLDEQYNNAREHVEKRQQRAREIASQLNSGLSRQAAIALISDGKLQTTDELVDSVRVGLRPYLDSEMLHYVHQAARDIHGIENLSYGSRLTTRASRRDAFAALVDPGRAMSDHMRHADLSQVRNFTSQVVQTGELDLTDPSTRHALALGASLGERDGILSATRELASLGELHGSTLERYEQIFGEGIEVTVGRRAAPEQWIYDEGASERDGVPRGRRLIGAQELIQAARRGQAPSHEMLNEYALGRMQEIGERTGEVLGTGFYDYQRSGTALEALADEKEQLTAQLSILYQAHPQLRTLHEEHRQVFERLAQSEVVERQIDDTLRLIEVARLRANSDRTGCRFMARRPEILERDLAQYMMRNSAVTSHYHGLEALRDRSTEIAREVGRNFSIASDAADSLYRSMHTGWNFLWLTDEDGVYDALRPLNDEQRKLALTLYSERYDRDVYNDIMREMSRRDRERAMYHARGMHTEAEAVALIQAGRERARNTVLERTSAILVQEARRDQATEVRELDNAIQQARFRGDDSAANALLMRQSAIVRELENESQVGVHLAARATEHQARFAETYDQLRDPRSRDFESVVNRGLSSQSAWQAAIDPEGRRAYELAHAIRKDPTKACELIEEEFNSFLEDYVRVELRRSADGDLDFSDERLSDERLAEFRAFLLSIDEAEGSQFTALVERRTTESAQHIFYDEQGALDEHMVRNFENFYEQRVLLPQVLPVISTGDIRENEALASAWQSHLNQLFEHEQFRREMRGARNVDHFIERNLSGARQAWFQSIVAGDYGAAQAHRVEWALVRRNDYALLESSFAQPRVITQQLELLEYSRVQRQIALERQQGRMLSAEDLQSDAIYANASRQLAELQEGAEALSSRRSETFTAHNNGRDMFARIESETSKEYAAAVRAIADNGFLDDVSRLELALARESRRNREELLQIVAGRSSAELDVLARELYVRERGSDPEGVSVAREYFDRRLLARVSGDQANDMRVMLAGTPETVEQMLKVLEIRERHVRSGATWFHDIIPGKLGVRLEEEVAQLRKAYATAVSETLGMPYDPLNPEFLRACVTTLEASYEGEFDDHLQRLQSDYHAALEQEGSLRLERARNVYVAELERRGATLVSQQELARLRSMYEMTAGTAEMARMAKNMASGMATDIAATGIVVVGTVGAVVVTVGTGGLGIGAGIAIAGGSAVVAGGVRTGGGRVLRGQGYGRHDFHQDLKSTAVDTGAALGGFGVGALATRGAGHVVGRVAMSGRLIPKAAEGGVRAGGVRAGETVGDFGLRVVHQSRLSRMGFHGAVGAGSEGLAIAPVASTAHLAISTNGFEGVTLGEGLSQVGRMTLMSTVIAGAAGGAMMVRAPQNVRSEQVARKAGVNLNEGQEGRKFAPDLRRSDIDGRRAVLTERAEAARVRLDAADSNLSPQQRRDLEIVSRRPERLDRAESRASRDMDRRFRRGDREATVEKQREVASSRADLDAHRAELKVRRDHVKQARQGGNEADIRDAQKALRQAQDQTELFHSRVFSARRALAEQQQLDRLTRGVANPSDALLSDAETLLRLRRDISHAIFDLKPGRAFATLRQYQRSAVNFDSQKRALIRQETAQAQDYAGQRVEQALSEKLLPDFASEWQARARELRATWVKANQRFQEVSDGVATQLARLRRGELPDVIQVARALRSELPPLRSFTKNSKLRYDKEVNFAMKSVRGETSAAEFGVGALESQARVETRVLWTERFRGVVDRVRLSPSQVRGHSAQGQQARDLRDTLRARAQSEARPVQFEEEVQRALRGLDEPTFRPLAEQAALARMAEQSESTLRGTVRAVREAFSSSVAAQSNFRAVGARADKALKRASDAMGGFDKHAQRFGNSSAGDQRAAAIVDLESRVPALDFELGEAKLNVLRSMRGASESLTQPAREAVEQIETALGSLRARIQTLSQTPLDQAARPSRSVQPANRGQVDSTDVSTAPHDGARTATNPRVGPAAVQRDATPRNTPGEAPSHAARYDRVAEIVGTDELTRVPTSGMQRGDSFQFSLEGTDFTVTISRNGRQLYVDKFDEFLALRAGQVHVETGTVSYFDPRHGIAVSPKLDTRPDWMSDAQWRLQRAAYGASIAHEQAHARGAGEFEAWKAGQEYLLRNGASYDLSGDVARVVYRGNSTALSDGDIRRFINRVYAAHGSDGIQAMATLAPESPTVFARPMADEGGGVALMDAPTPSQNNVGVVRAARGNQARAESDLELAQTRVTEARAELAELNARRVNEFQQFEHITAVQNARKQLAGALLEQRALQRRAPTDLKSRRPEIDSGPIARGAAADIEEALAPLRQLQRDYVTVRMNSGRPDVSPAPSMLARLQPRPEPEPSPMFRPRPYPLQPAPHAATRVPNRVPYRPPVSDDGGGGASSLPPSMKPPAPDPQISESELAFQNIESSQPEGFSGRRVRRNLHSGAVVSDSEAGIDDAGVIVEDIKIG